MEDARLLSEFVEHGSHDAFARLVERHVNLVYSAALRQLRDRHLAEEVAQGVFIALAIKAAKLREDVVLSAWLLVTTRYLALDALKKQARRRRHERKAAEMAQTLTPPADDGGWESLSPHIDAALAGLSAPDRQVVTLRYFEGRSVKEIASATGLGLDAVKQRVHRATLKMRAALEARGVNVATAALGPAILGNAIHAAPAGLASSITQAAFAARAGASAGLAGGTKGAAILMATAKTKLVAGVAVIVLLGGGAAATWKALQPPPPRIVALTAANPASYPLAPAPSPSPALPGWQGRFNAVYSLSEGQALKHVGLPMIPERQDWWNSQIGNRSGWTLTPQESFTIEWDGRKAKWTSLHAEGASLHQALQSCAGLKAWQVDPAIPQIKFEGDWVSRKGATPEQMMSALGPIVSEKLGHSVHFEKRPSRREVIVARGSYAFSPSDGHAADRLIVFWDGMKRDSAEPEPNQRRGSLADLLERVADATGKKIVNESSGAPPRIEWLDHARVTNPNALLRGLESQTGLRFEHEQRDVDWWTMKDGPG